MVSASVDRNREIKRRVCAGELKADVARDYGISRQRVDQIVHRRRARARKAATEVDISDRDHCERCGAPGPLEKHHRDYSRPRDVDVLCRPCHAEADAAQHELRARQEMGVRYDVPMEGMVEAARRVGVGTRSLRKGVDAGLLTSSREGAGSVVHLIAAEVDVWVDFLERLRAVRQENRGAVMCPSGHLLADWNVGNGLQRICRECNTLRANPNRATTDATNYEVCLELHEAGFRNIRPLSNRVTAEDARGTQVNASRRPGYRWILRMTGRRHQKARFSTPDQLRALIRGASHNGSAPTQEAP